MKDRVMSEGAHRSVLVVEDDEAIREAYSCLFEGEGYHVFSAKDGKVGLEILRTGLNPSLILLDLMMPVMSGTEFLDAIHEEFFGYFKDIPVVIVSAGVDKRLAEKFKVASFLKKPVDLNSLLQLVRKYSH